MPPPTGRDDERRSIERELKRGSLELIVLHLLAPGEAYGYEIVSKLTAETNGALAVTDGTCIRCSTGWNAPGSWPCGGRRRSAASRGSTTGSPSRVERNFSGSPGSGRRLPGRWRNCCDADTRRREDRQMTITADDYVNRVLFEDADSDAEPRANRDGAARTHQRARERGRTPRRDSRAPRRPGGAGRVIPVGRPADRRRLVVACDGPADRSSACRWCCWPRWPASSGLQRRPSGCRRCCSSMLFVGGATIAIYPMVAEASVRQDAWQASARPARGHRVWHADQQRAGHRAQPAAGCSRCGGSTRCLRCSPTGASARSSCCRRHVSCGRPPIRDERSTVPRRSPRRGRCPQQVVHPLPDPETPVNTVSPAWIARPSCIRNTVTRQTTAPGGETRCRQRRSSPASARCRARSRPRR